MEVVGPDLVDDRVAVQRAACPVDLHRRRRKRDVAGAGVRRGTLPGGVRRRGHAVATVTVWSAGPDRPGLLEPMGVHRDHRGHGHGTAICLAAAATLRDLGASSALVATPTSNQAAVATYASAGYRRLPDVTDLRLTPLKQQRLKRESQKGLDRQKGFGSRSIYETGFTNLSCLYVWVRVRKSWVRVGSSPVTNARTNRGGERLGGDHRRDRRTPRS